MPYTHAINPVLFSIGPFSVRYYGFAYIIGFLYCYYLLRIAARKQSVQGLDVKAADDLIIYIMLGIVGGARLGFFLFNFPLQLLQDPVQLFQIWNGGMSFHGGLIGVIIAGILFSRKHKISFFPLADIGAFVAPLALALGRLANFANGELVGRVTDVSWCVNFSGYFGCRHPYQLYESMALFMIFGFMLLLNQRKGKVGRLFWWFILLYGIERFFLSFWRDDPLMFMNLSGGQLLSVVMIITGALVLFQNIRSNNTL